MKAKRNPIDPGKFHWLSVSDAARRVAGWPAWKREYRLTENSPLIGQSSKTWAEANSELIAKWSLARLQENQTMWYEQDKKDELDYSKPIAAFRKNKGTSSKEYLLISHEDRYYWFNLYTGRLCKTNYKTVGGALAAFSSSFEIENVYIGLRRDVR